MKKISQIEKNDILEMHSKLKKPLISEQVVGDTKSKLSKMLDDGCVKNGEIVELQSKNPVLQFAIKQESTKTPGKFRYFFADNRVGSFDGNGKFEFSPSKWSCNAVQQATLAASTAKQQAANTEDIAREIEQNNYQRIEDINVTPSELAQLYEKHPKYNLWRLKFKTSKSGGFTEEQQAFIDQWKEDQIKKGNPGFTETLTPAQRAKGTFKAIKVSGTEQIFPNGGLTMYREPAVASNDIKSCKEAIEKYYTYWREDSEELTDSEFNSLKPFVQSCANRYHKRWGGVFSSIDNYVKILSGDEPGGPSSYGSDSKFRLKSPKNVRR
jgi:hypothetical protein